MQLITKIWGWCEHVVAQLGGRIITTLLLALLVAFSSVIFSDNWIVSISRQVEIIRTVRINIAVLHQLQANLYEAESAQRGYMLTKRKEYVAPFNNALKQARENIALSETLVKETSTVKNQVTELQWLKQISASLEAKSAEMLLTIKLIEQNKIDAANQVVDLDLGRQQMQAFIIATDKLIAKQSKDVDDMIEKRRATVIYARISVIGESLILIFLVAMVIKQLLTELAAKNLLQQKVVQENANYEVKLKEQTKLLRSMALDYQADVERERQKLSRELHDELGSIFTATKMDLAWCMKKLAQSAPDVADKLAKTTGYVDQGIAYHRHVVQELHPSMISTFGFWPALTVLINDAAERNKWQLTLNLPHPTTPINATIGLVAYRVVQESLNNANKYAKATLVIVDVMLDEHYLKLEISDNGIGVDMTILDGLTHGLSGMRNRVLAIGGHFEMVSKPNAGVLIKALIPLDVVASNADKVVSQANAERRKSDQRLNS